VSLTFSCMAFSPVVAAGAAPACCGAQAFARLSISLTGP